MTDAAFLPYFITLLKTFTSVGQRNQGFWLAAGIGLVLDQLTKFWIIQNFELTVPPQTVSLWSGVLHLTYITNAGAAFGLCSDHACGNWLPWLSFGVSLGLAALGIWVRLANRWEQVGYGCILSGALGNGIDRLLVGEVVDFLDFRLLRVPAFSLQNFDLQWTPFPIFNVADICINIGVVCLLVAAFWPQKPPQKDSPGNPISPS